MANLVTLIIIGAAAGALYSLAAIGIVVVYRGSGVINLASGAIGMVGAFTFLELSRGGSFPAWAAAAMGIAIASVIGLLTHVLVLRPLEDRSGLTKLIAVLAVVVVLQAGATLIWPVEVQIVPSLLPRGRIEFLPNAFVGPDRLWILGIVVVLSAVLTYVYRATKFGLCTAAVAESPRATASLGYSVNAIASANWLLAGALSGTAAILLTPISGLQITTGTLLVIPALAAALLGGMRSFPLTIAGGLGIGVAQAVLTQYASRPGWPIAVPFLTIILVLVVRGSGLPLREGRTERPPLLGSGLIRPVPILVAVGMYTAAVLTMSPRWTDSMTTTVGTAIIVLSVVVLTGYAGQLSLAQFTMAGLGALIAGRASAAWGIPFELALLLGVLGTVPLCVLFAFPALRTRGVNLAVATIGLAVAVQGLVFTDPWFTGGLIGTRIQLPSVLGIDVGAVRYPERYALVCLVGFLAAALAVSNLRRSPGGRALIAMRANERAAASVGINVTMAKLFAFGLAGGIAALGGILLAFRNNTIVFGEQYQVLRSVDAVMYAVVGGLGQVGGPLVGALMQPGSLASRVFEFVIEDYPTIFTLIAGVATIVVLNKARDGLVVLHGSHLRAVWTSLAARRPVRSRQQPSAVSVGGDPVAVPARQLTVSGIEVFSGVAALRGAALRIRPGEVVGMIGPNGAGKTTLIDVMSGFVAPTGGRVVLDETDVTDWDPHRRAAAGLARSFQGLELFDGLTVEENLRTGAESADLRAYVKGTVSFREPPVPSRVLAVADFFDLTGELDRLPMELSYGRRRIVAIARAVVMHPSILMLDEPAAGLDDLRTAELGVLIRRLADEWGMGVLLVEHHVDLVMRTCDRIIALDAGQVIAEGTPSDVRADPALARAYLGA